MKRPSLTDLLYKLRQQLDHFDRSPDFGDAEAVAAIRGYLVLRIREAERLMHPGFPAKRAQQTKAA
jgi:hypothetical protein